MRCQHIAKCSLSGCGHWPGTYVRSVYVLESHPPQAPAYRRACLDWSSSQSQQSRRRVERGGSNDDASGQHLTRTHVGGVA